MRVCLHVCLHVNVQGKDESYMYHQTMYYWWLCACMCACTVKMRAMSPKCMAKPCATGLCVYICVFVQSEDQNYAQNVYHQAMYSWSLSAYACSE